MSCLASRFSKRRSRHNTSFCTACVFTSSYPDGAGEVDQCAIDKSSRYIVALDRQSNHIDKIALHRYVTLCSMPLSNKAAESSSAPCFKGMPIRVLGKPKFLPRAVSWPPWPQR